MNIKFGEGITKYGPGVDIELTSNEVATAIDAYLTAHNIVVSGARTINITEEGTGKVYVDPTGCVIFNGKRYTGRGTIEG
jgi:hypothetical protein